jgi:hypothetical protein
MVMTLLCYENEAVSVELVESRLGITHKTAQRLCQIIDGHLRTLAAPDAPDRARCAMTAQAGLMAQEKRHRPADRRAR